MVCLILPVRSVRKISNFNSSSCSLRFELNRSTGLFNRKERKEHREKQLRTLLIFCLTCQLDRLENCQFQFFFVFFAFFVVKTGFFVF